MLPRNYVKTVALCVNTKQTFPFPGENVYPVTQKIWEDGIVTSRPVRSLFPKQYKVTGSLCDCLKGKSNQLAKHFQHHR